MREHAILTTGRALGVVMDETYAVLLEDMQRHCGKNQFCVTATGTRAEMLALDGQVHDGTVQGLSKRHWIIRDSHPIIMRHPGGTAEAPGIVVLFEHLPGGLPGDVSIDG
jgi:hypothetical protein